MIITPKITRVQGISEKRRLPRLGKIRLGVKVINPKTGNEYPKETPYFVVPEEVAKVYGSQPIELDVMFPVNSLDIVFPQAFKWYGDQKGLKCIGNGQIAYRLDENSREMIERECPCELLGNGCALRCHLLVILPKVNMGGVYQIDVGSYNSVVDINSGLEYIEFLIGRFAMVPLKLRRVPREIPYEGQKRLHYPLQIVFEGDVNLINQLREDNKRIIIATESIALPAPEDINPKHDPEAVIVVEDTNGGGDAEVQQPVSQQQSAPQSVQAPVNQQESKKNVQHGKPLNESKPKEQQKPVASSKPPTEAQLNAIRNMTKRKGFNLDLVETFISTIESSLKASQIITSFGKGDYTELENFIAEITSAEEIEVPEEVTTQEPF